MNTARVSLCLAILLACTLSSPARAQYPAGPASGGGWYGDDGTGDQVPGASDRQTTSIFDNRNYMLRSDAGDSVGYLRGFQTFAAFQPVIITPDELILWMSPRGYVTYNSGTFGGNLGAGARWLDPSNQRILGGGFWWDHDNNGQNQYDQLGGSFEWLGNFFDLRANAYLPTNQNLHHTSQTINFLNPIFVGHNIALGETICSTNSSLAGGDFEAGGALPGIGDLGLRTYAGGYYYQGPQSAGGVYGVRARAEALVTQDFWGTVAVTHDRLFGTNVIAAVTWYLGTGNTPRWFQRISQQTRLYQQMERQYRVSVVQQQVVCDVQLALRAGGVGGSGGPVGTPIFVDHVNNTAPAGGDGSVEHPFNHLPTTTPGNVDIIFVNRGNNTSSNMNQGITLNDFQRLLGDGVMHSFTSLQGTFTLPGFTPGPFPTITNTNAASTGDGVTLANMNEVSGFNITGTNRHGIFGSGINNAANPALPTFNINHVNISNAGALVPAPVPPVGDGIHLDNASGFGTITDSNFTSNAVNGVQIASTLSSAATPLAVTLDNDTYTSNGANGLLINNVGPAPGPGNFGQEISATVTRSTFTTNTGMGIEVNDINSVTNLTVGDAVNAALGNTFTGNHSAAIGYITNGTPDPLLPVANVGIFNNTISGTLSGPVAPGDGLYFSLRGGSPGFPITPRLINIQIDNNTITGTSASGAAADGIHMEYRELVGSPLLQIDGNTITGFTGNGINVLTANWNSTLARFAAATMDNNTVTGNTLNGVIFTAQDSTVDSWALSGNKFNSNTLNGLIASTSTNAVFVMTSTNDQFIGNTGNGVSLTSNDATAMGTIGLTALGPGPSPIIFDGATIESNKLAGMALTSNSLSNFNIIVQNSIIGHYNAANPSASLGNTKDGVAITTNGSSQMIAGTSANPWINNEISANGGNGISITTNGTSQLSGEFDSSQIDHNTLDGVRAAHFGGTISAAQTAFTTPNDPTLFTAGSTVQATFNNDDVSYNGGNGFNISFTGTAGTIPFTVAGTGTGYTITNSTITGNGARGIFLETNSGLMTNTFVVRSETAPGSGVYTPPAANTVTDFGGGTVNWADATVANDVTLIADGNTISGNGAEGMFLRIGTMGYVHADVQRNSFTGFGANGATDFRTESFVSGGNTLNDVVLIPRNIGLAIPEFRQIFLDNIAQLDLRFTSNTGNSIAAVTALGATFAPVPGVSSVKNGNSFTNVYNARNVNLFAVEDTYAGGSTSVLNDFNTFPVSGAVQTSFTTGGYDLGPAPSANFPSPPFPLYVP